MLPFPRIGFLFFSLLGCVSMSNTHNHLQSKALNMLTFKSKSSRQKSNLPLSSGSRREADDEDTTSEERVTIKFCTDEEGNVTNRIAAGLSTKNHHLSFCFF